MRRAPIVLLSILLIILIIVGYAMMEPDAAQEVLVELGLSEPEVEGYVVTGMLEARVTHLGSVNGGRILKFEAEVGERVARGEIVVELEQNLLEPLLLAAQARLEASQAQLDLLQAPPRTVDLVLAKAAVNYAHALSDGASQSLEDAREFAPESIRGEQIALAQAAVDQAQAGLDIAKANLDALEEGATESQIKSLEAAVDAAQAEVAKQEAVLDNQVIVAPIAGVVLNHYALPGELVLPGEQVVSLAELDMLELRVFLPEADIGWARLGEEVQLSIDAYPDRVFTGEVIFIAEQSEFTPRNVQTPEDRIILVYEIRILVPNPDGALKPGLPADVTFGVKP